MKKLLILAITLCSSLFTVDAADKKDLVDYVNPLVGSQSKISLSTGNTYPAIAMPWGMNFWMPQTGKMGDGWAYTYDADKIRGFKQTHQPSPWINDYGQFAIMPVTGKVVFNQDKRASWFSHKAEVAKPNYYRVYLADHDVVTEITPTERAAMFRFTFPESDNSYVIVDAFDRGSYVKIIPEENTTWRGCGHSAAGAHLGSARAAARRGAYARARRPHRSGSLAGFFYQGPESLRLPHDAGARGAQAP